MEHFVGLDVATRSSALCVVDRHGEVVLEREIATDPDVIASVLRPYARTVRGLGHEAGALAPWLQDQLTAAGLPASCLETRHVRATLAAQRNKTDRNDARGIAQLMRTGWFKPVQLKSRDGYRLRLALIHRRTLKRKFLDIENAVRHSLKVFGIRLGLVSRGKLDAAVREAVAGDTLLESLCGSMLAARAALGREVERLDRLVRQLAEEDEVCRRFMAIPGVGPMTALAFKTAIETPERFARSRDVGAYLGLTPRRWQSGDSEGHNGPISRRGDAELRTLLYEAANAMLTRSTAWCTLKAWGAAQVKRIGHKRAVTAMARRLGVIMHAMWRDGTVFQYGPGKWAEDIPEPTDRAGDAEDSTSPAPEPAPQVRCSARALTLVRRARRNLPQRLRDQVQAALDALDPADRAAAEDVAARECVPRKRGRPPARPEAGLPVAGG